MYREAGQFKTSYQADQAIFPIAQDRWFMVALFVALFARLRKATPPKKQIIAPTRRQLRKVTAQSRTGRGNAPEPQMTRANITRNVRLKIARRNWNCQSEIVSLANLTIESWKASANKEPTMSVAANAGRSWDAPEKKPLPAVLVPLLT